MNLGPVDRFYNATPGGSFGITDFTSTQFSDAFGTSDGVGLAAFAAMRVTDDPDRPFQTLWVAAKRSDPTVQSTPWKRQGAGTLGTTATRISSIGSGVAVYSAATAVGVDNTATATVIPSSNPNGYSTYFGTGNFKGTFQGNAENVAPVGFSSGTTVIRSDLYEIRPGSGASIYLGYFEMAPSGAVSFTAAKAGQTIDFPTIADVPYSEGGTVTLGAIASTGLPVTYAVLDGPATVAGDVLTVTGVGPVTVEATQSGDTTHSAADPVDLVINIVTGTQTITFAALPNIDFAPGTTIILTGTASSGLAVSYSVTKGSATVAGSVLTVTGSGLITVLANQAGNTDYTAAIGVAESFFARLGINAVADTLGVVEGHPTSVASSRLLANDTDRDGLALQLSGVSAPGIAGATVTLAAGIVTYTPAPGFVGSDSFLYTATDAAGNVATATVSVSVRSSDDPAQNQLSPPQLLADGNVGVRFAGIPGRTYVIQVSPDPTGPWTDFMELVADDLGRVVAVDTEQPRPPSRFYRTLGL